MYVSRDTVEVRVEQFFDPVLPRDIAAWWPANGNGVEVYTGQLSQTYNWAGYADGMVAQAFDFDGIDDYRVAPVKPSFSIGNHDDSPGASIEMWVNQSVSNDSYLVRWSANQGIRFYYGSIYFYLTDGVSVNKYLYASNLSELNRWQHVVCTYDKASGIARIWVDGVQRDQQNIGSFNLATTGDIQIGSPQFAGQLDELTFYDQALTPEEITALFNAGETGKPPVMDNEAPLVDAGLDRMVASVSESLQLSATVSDDGNPLGSLPELSWSLLSGPEGLTISDETVPDPLLSFTNAGIYVL
jgi:hypothetical protein